MDSGNLILVFMVRVCVWNIYRDESSGFWWKEVVGETPTSATTLTYLVILSEVRLWCGCLCKIHTEWLSGVAETFSILLKLHLVKMYLFIHYYLHQIQNQPPKSVTLLFFYLCFTLTADLQVLKKSVPHVWKPSGSQLYRFSAKHGLILLIRTCRNLSTSYSYKTLLWTCPLNGGLDQKTYQLPTSAILWVCKRTRKNMWYAGIFLLWWWICNYIYDLPLALNE